MESLGILQLDVEFQRVPFCVLFRHPLRPRQRRRPQLVCACAAQRTETHTQTRSERQSLTPTALTVRASEAKPGQRATRTALLGCAREREKKDARERERDKRTHEGKDERLKKKATTKIESVPLSLICFSVSSVNPRFSSTKTIY